MSAFVQERYHSIICAVNAPTSFTSNGVGGFIAVTTGFIAIATSAGVSLLPTVAVTAGVYLPIPMYVSVNGGVITTSGGASGVLLID